MSFARSLELCVQQHGKALTAKKISVPTFMWNRPQTEEAFFVFLTAFQAAVRSCNYGQSESVEIVQTKLKFGPRPWFVCPGTHHGAPCRRRVRILYFLPSTYRMGCRKCHNLIHRSAREHDKRIDALLKLPINEFRDALHHDVMKLGSLAWRVNRALSRQLDRDVRRNSA